MALRAAALALTCAALALTAAPAGASADVCTRYASPFGNDTAAGTETFPYRTAQRLANALRAGETGCLMSGTYDREMIGPYVLRVGHGGEPGAPITIRSVPGQRATLRGIVYVPEGSDHVTLTDLDFDARRPTVDKSSGIQIMAADTIIQDSDITNHASAICMVLGSPGWGVAVRTILRRNVFHDCGWKRDNKEHAVYVELTEAVTVTDNLFLRSGAYAVHLYPYAQGTTVTHNVMVDNGGGVVFAGESSAVSSDNVVEDNIITGSWMRPGIHSSWGSSVGERNLARDNCLYANPNTNVDISSGGFAARDNIIADPRFRDPAAADYRMSAGSACLQVVGYDTVAKLRGDAPDPAPAGTPTPTPTATAAPTTTPPPAPAPVAPEPILPPGNQTTAPQTDPGTEPVEAARLMIDDEAFSASGGTTVKPRPCRRKRCR